MTQHDEQGEVVTTTEESLLRMKTLMVRQSAITKGLAEISREALGVVTAHADMIERLQDLTKIQAEVIQELTHRVLVLEGKVK